MAAKKKSARGASGGRGGEKAINRASKKQAASGKPSTKAKNPAPPAKPWK